MFTDHEVSIRAAIARLDRQERLQARLRKASDLFLWGCGILAIVLVNL